MKITLPDGQIRSCQESTTGLELATQISPGLAKTTVAMRVNGKLHDVSENLTEDAPVVFLTIKDKLGLDVVRHSTTAQVLAKAIKELFPQAKLAIGPTIEFGFYYDIEFENAISSDDLRIEPHGSQSWQSNSAGATFRKDLPAELQKLGEQNQGPLRSFSMDNLPDAQEASGLEHGLATAPERQTIVRRLGDNLLDLILRLQSLCSAVKVHAMLVNTIW